MIGKTKLLTEANQEGMPEKKLNLLKPKAKILQGFRLREVDIKYLQDLVRELNRLDPNNKITKTDVISGLIFAARKREPDKLLKDIKESGKSL